MYVENEWGKINFCIGFQFGLPLDCMVLLFWCRNIPHFLGSSRGNNVLLRFEKETNATRKYITPLRPSWCYFG